MNMLTIHRRRVDRPITEEEMVRLKGQAPFSTFRQDSKAINFGFIFGMTFRTFAKRTIQLTWSHDKIDQFVEDYDLMDLKWEFAKKYPDSIHECGSWAVAEYFRKKFFKTYPGLMERIQRNIETIKEHGYIRSFHGAIRRSPLRMLAGPDDDRSEIAGYDNIAANTTIQNDEACKVMQAITEIGKKWVDKNFDAWVFGTVHDSVDFVINKKVIKEALKDIHEVFEKEEDWQKGVQLPIDITVVDFTREDHYYKRGMGEWEVPELRG